MSQIYGTPTNGVQILTITVVPKNHFDLWDKSIQHVDTQY